jgi:serine phosphatase RsbU (regulator of sigma subunit)
MDAPRTQHAHSIRVAAAARPHPRENENGDSWIALTHGSGHRIVVVDGLGHGPDAATAARAAVDSFTQTIAMDLEEAIRRCHQALTGTRGAALAVADVDPGKRTLTYAGVGNVEARIWHASRPDAVERPISYRGIVGSTLPTVRSFDFALGTGWRVLLHTDGISARFDLAELPASGDPQVLADAILDAWARPTDDATVVVAAEA